MISQKLVQYLNDGEKLTVKSEPGKGSKFSFIIKDLRQLQDFRQESSCIYNFDPEVSDSIITVSEF